PSLAGPFHVLFPVWRHALANRGRISIIVPARILFLKGGIAQVGMGGARLDSLRILAGVGPVSGGAREFRLARRRRSRDVERAAQLNGIRGALERALQIGQPLGPVLPEPVPARK